MKIIIMIFIFVILKNLNQEKWNLLKQVHENIIYRIVGWFYRKKRQYLDINNLESLFKIRYYNLTNMWDKLSYSVRNKMDDELVKMIEKLYLLNDTSDEEDIEDTEVSDDESDYLVISDHEV